MTATKEELQKLEVKVHNIDKRVQENERNDSLIMQEIKHVRDNFHQKFDSIYAMLEILKKSDEKQTLDFLNLENKFVNEKSFENGLKSGRENQRKNISFILGTLVSLIAIVGFLTVHEFGRDKASALPHHVQQTIIRAK